MISKRISLLIGLMMDHTLNFYAEINDNGVKVERCYPGAMGDNVYKLSFTQCSSFQQCL